MSRKRLGPRGVVGEPKAKTAARTSFIVRCNGYYLTLSRGRVDNTMNEGEAKRFSTHAEAVKFCKEYVRKGLFGGDWRSVTKIEEASTSEASS